MLPLSAGLRSLDAIMFNRIIKACRALLAIIIGCFILIPFLFIIATILVFIGAIERIFETNYSTKIAKKFGDEGAEFLKMISGTK